MQHRTKKSRSRSLPEAALRLSQWVHERYPEAVITPLEVPYADEDLTIDVSLPEAYSLQEVSDTLIRLCLEIEDELGVTILTQASRLPHKAYEASPRANAGRLSEPARVYSGSVGTHAWPGRGNTLQFRVVCFPCPISKIVDFPGAA